MARRKYLKQDEIDFVIKELEGLYPDAKAELDFTNAFELLIATILSAQCTDVRVNIVTAELFKIVKGPQDIVDMSVKELQEHIRTCGLYQTKAKNIKATCKILVDEFNSVVPDDRDVLVKLPGVGRKTANVVVSNAFNQPAIAVDTHVFRVSNRLGLAASDNVLQTEKQLMKRLPKEIWSKTHHTLIFHGRRQCKARKPDCETCPVKSVCLYYKYNSK
tara:strand:- start:947 stop:1600 length:654 start_codon:yes stop_codon:yes gene_type:complete